MSISTHGRAPASTFLTHFFGGGLLDKGECYAVERFRALSNGEIRCWHGEVPPKSNGHNRPKPEVASLDTVQNLRPAYNEIIVCTALGSRSGVQLYGYAACGLFSERTRRHRSAP